LILFGPEVRSQMASSAPAGATAWRREEERRPSAPRLPLVVPSERFGKWTETLASHALRKHGIGAASLHHGPAKLTPLIVRFGESSPDGAEEER